MDTAKQFTAIEFCAGYAGIHLGLKRAIPGLRVIALSEIEAFACANLVSKMEAGLLDAAPIWTDLKSFPGIEFRDRVDILVGGYPCQPFSAAGKRLGADDPRHLWPFIREQVRLIRPRYCFFENVDGHVSMGLSTVLSDLEEDGYRTTWGVFSASEVGAPHQRKRVFILAARGDEMVHAGGQRRQQVAGSASGYEGSEWSDERSDHQFDSADESGQLAHTASCRSGIRPEVRGEDGRQVGGLLCQSQSPDESNRLAHTASECNNVRGLQLRAEEGRREGVDPETGHRCFELADLQHTRLEGHAGHGDDCNESGRLESLATGSIAESCGSMANTRCIRSQGPEQQATGAEQLRLWPSRPGERQHCWEPPRTVANAIRPVEAGRGAGCGNQEGAGAYGEPGGSSLQAGQAESAVGGNVDGTAGRLDDAELYESCDNRTDELRLLGNGVVPATAERAWRVLFARLTLL